MKSAQYKVVRQLVNTRRHVTGYIIGNRRVPVATAARMAAEGKLLNVVRNADHIQSRPGTRRLSDLPMTVVH